MNNVLKTCLTAILVAGMALIVPSCTSNVGVSGTVQNQSEYLLEFKCEPENSAYFVGLAVQTLLPGEQSTVVEVKPESGYNFVSWSDGSTDPVRPASEISENTTLTAICEEVTDTCPVIYITTENECDVQSDTTYVNFIMSVDNIEKQYILNDVSGQMKCRGNASMGWAKKSFTLKLDEKYDLCGLGEKKSKNWVLISNHCDQSLMRNYIAFWLQGKLDNIPWSPECKLVDVYLNGEYNGNYMLIEKVTVAGNRIDITNGDEGDLEADFLIELDNYAYKAGDNGIVWFTAKGYPYEIRGEDNLTSERCNYIDSWVTDAWVTVTEHDEDAIREILDIPSAVDSYILAEVTKNIDCGWSSFFLYRKDGKLYLGPSWDFDLAMGNDERLDGGSYEGLYAGKYNGFSQQNQWYIELMECEWFQKLVLARWNEVFGSSVFDDMIDEIDRVYEICGESFENNFVRWPIFGQKINQEPSLIRSFDTTKLHVDYLKEWLANRVMWLDEYFNSNL